MLYVRRNSEGKLQSVSHVADDLHTEAIEPTHSEVKVFLGGEKFNALFHVLEESDVRLVRVLEDLLDILMNKEVILFTDLPAAAQNKLLERRSVRSRISAVPDLLGDQDDQLMMP